MAMPTDRDRAHRVVIVGGGFGGLQTALGLRRAPVEITLIDQAWRRHQIMRRQAV